MISVILFVPPPAAVSSKRGGDLSILKGSRSRSKKATRSRPSRSGLNKNLTASEVKQAVNFREKTATKNKKGSSRTPSTRNSARIVKGDR